MKERVMPYKAVQWFFKKLNIITYIPTFKAALYTIVKR